MKVHDEVCGMEFDRRSSKAVMRFRGTTYYFCSIRCHKKFAEHPGWYVDTSAPPRVESQHADPPSA